MRAIYKEKEYPVKGFCKSARGEELVDLILPNGMFERVYKDEVLLLEDKQENIDWEQRRYELAKETLLTLISKDLGATDGIADFIKKNGTMYHFHSTLSVKYADALIAKLKEGVGGMDDTFTPWISVDDKLPEVGADGWSNPVLAYPGRGCTPIVAKYSDGTYMAKHTFKVGRKSIVTHWFGVHPIDPIKMIITHWMPFPELPKD